MAYEVLWTQRAYGDVDAIVRHISEVLDSPQAARSHLEAFLAAGDELAESPQLYGVSRVERVESLRVRDLRVKFVKRYALIYSFDGERVIVKRIVSTLSDYGRLIEDA